MMGGRGPSDFFGSEILAQSDFLGVYERHWQFFGSQRKTEGFFWVVKIGLRGFLGYAEKSSDFFG